MAQRLQGRVLRDATDHSPSARQIMAAGVATPLTCTPYEPDSDEERRRWRKRQAEHHNKGSHGTRSTLSGSDGHGKRK